MGLTVEGVLTTGVRGGTGAFGFVMSQTPFISSISPTRNSNGWTLVVRGSGFGAGFADNEVTAAPTLTLPLPLTRTLTLAEALTRTLTITLAQALAVALPLTSP